MAGLKERALKIKSALIKEQRLYLLPCMGTMHLFIYFLSPVMKLQTFILY